MKELTNSAKAAIIGKIKGLVLKYHINAAGIDYDAWSNSLDRKAPDLAAAEHEQFESGVRGLLADLRTSHTAFFHNVPDRLLPQHTIGATLRKVRVIGVDHWMFLDVFEGGAVERAGIKPGWLLLAIDGNAVPTGDVPMFETGRRYSFTIGQGESRRRDIQIEVPFAKGSKAQPPLVPPKTIVSRILKPRIGYLKIGWFTASMGLGFAKELDAVIGDLKKNGCERLIVDLRGNLGGGLGFARLASYMCPGEIAIGQSLTPKRLRAGEDLGPIPRVPMPSTATGLAVALTRFIVKDKSLVLLTQGLGPQPFHGNIVVLVNECTNSAAEMVANFALENGLATVVGTKTCGTVLGARNFPVGMGYWLRLPVFGWFTSNGKTIEGRGVTPDVQIDQVPALLESGEDAQMAEAVALLSSKMARSKVGSNV